MPITLGSNIAALRGQQSLSRVTSELRTVYERLSSGQRINRAVDDAAGLAVSESLKADSRIFTQGIRNVNDGISLLSIADAAVANLSTIVVRLQELAEQAANGIYGSAQRAALDQEAQTLSKEFTRIQQTTTFNGLSLLNGGLETLRIQAGIGTSAMLDLGVGGNIGNGLFGTNNTIPAGPINTISQQLVDLNADGLPDMIGLNTNTTELQVSLNTGNGNFTSPVSYTVDNNLATYSLGDFNGDGIFDLVLPNDIDNDYDIRLGRADGTFGSAISTALSSSVSEFALGDVNGDGRLDMVGRFRSSATVSVLLGNGDGTFQAASSLTTSNNNQSIRLADFDGDGSLDVATYENVANPDVNIYYGNGNGTFNSTPTTLDTGATAAGGSLEVADLNNDGRPDLLVADSAAGATILLNQGNRTYASAVTYTTGGAQNFQVRANDLNGDGLLDLLTGHNAGLQVRLNTGNGAFGAATDVNAGVASHRGMALADINADGVLDIISSNTTANVNRQLGLTVAGTAPILPFSLKTIADSRQAIMLFKNKSALLSQQRGNIGAYQSRLNVASNVLSSARENFINAAARIKDADIAGESANLVRNRILQQAASSVMNQASLQPELALSLL